MAVADVLHTKHSLLPSDMKTFDLDLNSAAIHNSDVYFKAYQKTEEDLKDYPVIRVMKADGEVKHVERLKFTPSDHVIAMEVNNDRLFLLNKVLKIQEKNYVTVEIIILYLNEPHRTMRLTTHQYSQLNDWSTMAVGRHCVYHLRLDSWSIVGYDNWKNVIDHSFALHSLKPRDAGYVELRTCSLDHVVLIELDLVIYAAHLQEDRILWSYKIKTRGSFKCFNDIGIQLIPEERQVLIVDMKKGKKPSISIFIFLKS